MDVINELKDLKGQVIGYKKIFKIEEVNIKDDSDDLLNLKYLYNLILVLEEEKYEIKLSHIYSECKLPEIEVKDHLLNDLMNRIKETSVLLEECS